MNEFKAVEAQATRLGKLHMPKGVGELALLKLTGDEAVDGLFRYRVEAFSPNLGVDLDAGLGRHVTVEIETVEHGARFFDGILTEAEWLGIRDHGQCYGLTLRPWFWLAGKRRNQRIFHNRTAPQILAEVLGEYSRAGAFKDALVKSYPVIEYTVQYRETDLDFCCRMMEAHGISYHFVTEMGAHRMILTDGFGAHAAIPGQSREFKAVEGFHRSGAEHFRHWSPGRRLTTGKISLADYNFKAPTSAMDAMQVGDARHEEGQIESFDYPGGYLEQNRGNDLARLRVDEERSRDRRHSAAGDVMAMAAGMLVTPKSHPDKAVDGKEFMCTRMAHDYTAEGYSSGSEAGGAAYDCRAEFVRTDVAYAPARVTKWAQVQGPQTAMVVGAGEIDCDEYGRILVRFHWDRDNAYSMRCRVSQIWAGKGWGGMAIPRIGMEVIVEFLEGDPDQPIVTGCVYNGKNTVPYALPANKTVMTVKSQTHEGKGFNEIRFEDQAENEEIFIHAQKNRNEKTLNNHSERIDRNWVQSVGHNKAIEVTNHHDEVVGGNMSIYVGPTNIGSLVGSVVNRLAQGIGIVAERLGLPRAVDPSRGNLMVGVEKSKTEAVGLASNEMVGISKTVVVGQHFQLNAGDVATLHAGNILTLDSGDTAELSGARRAEMKSGMARIILEQDGTVGVYGTRINIGASDAVSINATNSVKITAKRIDLN